MENKAEVSDLKTIGLSSIGRDLEFELEFDVTQQAGR